jgi:hypothetical protein
MSIQTYPPTVPPVIEREWSYGTYYDTKTVLIKDVNGTYFLAYATVYVDENKEITDFYWSYDGPQGLTVGNNNIISWAYIPEF